jgi:hypothetical protein
MNIYLFLENEFKYNNELLPALRATFLLRKARSENAPRIIKRFEVQNFYILLKFRYLQNRVTVRLTVINDACHKIG